MQEYEGYFEGNRFIPFGATNIPERRKARVIVLDEVVSDDVGQQLSELDELIAMIKSSSDEVIPAFERADLHREVDL